MAAILFKKLVTVSLIVVCVLGLSIQFVSVNVSAQVSDKNTVQVIENKNQVWKESTDKVTSQNQNGQVVQPMIIWKPVVVTGVVIAAVKKIAAATGLAWNVVFSFCTRNWTTWGYCYAWFSGPMPSVGRMIGIIRG